MSEEGILEFQMKTKQDFGDYMLEPAEGGKIPAPGAAYLKKTQS